MGNRVKVDTRLCQFIRNRCTSKIAHVDLVAGPRSICCEINKLPLGTAFGQVRNQMQYIHLPFR